MNWDQMEGKWKQMKGSVKKQWGKLTDDDLEYIAGSKDQFVGRLQERYGITKEVAQKQADEWLRAQAEGGEAKTTTTTTTTRRSGGGA
jgi:uncharacterized protein YjbJ (UPF0337 family)